MVGARVLAYLTYFQSFLSNSHGVAANVTAIIEFGAHVVVVRSLWLGYVWMVRLVELGHWIVLETKQWFLWNKVMWWLGALAV